MAILRTISIEKELDNKFQQFCKKNAQTISGLIALLIKNHLKNGERTDGTEEKI